MTSLLLWMNRSGTYAKIERLFGAGGALPLGGPLIERIENELDTDALPFFDPDRDLGRHPRQAAAE